MSCYVFVFFVFLCVCVCFLLVFYDVFSFSRCFQADHVMSFRFVVRFLGDDVLLPKQLDSLSFLWFVGFPFGWSVESVARIKVKLN